MKPVEHELTSHHDGHGLNESIKIEADGRNPNSGGASHEYQFSIKTHRVGYLQFQEGPRKEPNSTPGITEAALLAVLIDRLEAFQAGPFPCDENAQQLEHLKAALALTKKRADDRAARQVLGKNEV